MAPDKIGSLIGAIGGLVFVQANAGAFPNDIELALRVVGFAAFVAVLVALPRLSRPASTDTRPPATLGRGYVVIVVAEVLAIAVGSQLLSGPLHTPAAEPAWIAFVVGAHFIALGLLFRQVVLGWLLGLSVMASGSVGLAVAFLGGSEPVIAAFAGIVPGTLLLASTLLTVDGTRAGAVA